MTWVALRKPGLALFNAKGIDAGPAPGAALPDGAISRGTLLLDAHVRPSLSTQTLLSYKADHPSLSGLTITLAPNGTVTLRQWQGQGLRHFVLRTDLQERAAGLTLLFTWDAAARRGALSVEVPGTGASWFTALRDPLLLPQECARRIATDRGAAFVSRSVGMVALADGVMPLGPLPSLGAQTLLETDAGQRAISTLRPGARVAVMDGSFAQVRWVGAVTLPAFDRFRPLRLRAPFYGAYRDLDCAACQQIRFRNSAVEYLFDTDAVSARAGDLLEGMADRRAPDQLTETYWQVVLDRSDPMQVHGLPCESLNVAPLLADPALRALSVLGGVPLAVLPRRDGATPKRLQAYEVRSLCTLRAA